MIRALGAEELSSCLSKTKVSTLWKSVFAPNKNDPHCFFAGYCWWQPKIDSHSSEMGWLAQTPSKSSCCSLHRKNRLRWSRVSTKWSDILPFWGGQRYSHHLSYAADYCHLVATFVPEFVVHLVSKMNSATWCNALVYLSRAFLVEGKLGSPGTWLCWCWHLQRVKVLNHFQLNYCHPYCAMIGCWKADLELCFLQVLPRIMLCS